MVKIWEVYNVSRHQNDNDNADGQRTSLDKKVVPKKKILTENN